MAKNRIISIFFILTLLALAGLFFIFYDNYQFKSNRLSSDVKQHILNKERDILKRIRYHYKINFKAPIIITDVMPGRKFGMASYNSTTQEIKIYLNKKRFKESEDYMINDVLPHEYAHALMFALGEFSRKNSGHTKRWQRACINLGGIKCDRFVNHQDIVIDKTDFFK